MQTNEKKSALFDQIWTSPHLLMLWLGLMCVLDLEIRGPKARMLGGSITTEQANMLIRIFSGVEMYPPETLAQECPHILPNLYTQMLAFGLAPERLPDILLYFFYYHTREGVSSTPVSKAVLEKKIQTADQEHEMWGKKGGGGCINPFRLASVKEGGRVFVHAGQILCPVELVPECIWESGVRPSN